MGKRDKHLTEGIPERKQRAETEECRDKRNEGTEVIV